MPHLLQEQGQAEQRPVQDQVEDQPDAGGAAEAPGAEQAERQHRRGLPALGAHEAPGRDDTRTRQRARQRAEPAELARDDKTRGESGQRQHAEHQPRHIRPPRRVERRLPDVPAQQGDGQQADRHVDYEDGPPARHRHRHTRTAEDRAERDSQRAHATPHAERTGTGPRVGELVHQQGERAGQQRRRPQALHGAGGDQDAQRRRGRAGRRTNGERRQPEHEDLAGADPVRGGTSGEHDRGQGKRVGVDDPLQPGERAANLVLDGGQRDVHDRDV
jgi:hypothetical protein